MAPLSRRISHLEGKVRRELGYYPHSALDKRDVAILAVVVSFCVILGIIIYSYRQEKKRRDRRDADRARCRRNAGARNGSTGSDDSVQGILGGIFQKEAKVQPYSTWMMERNDILGREVSASASVEAEKGEVEVGGETWERNTCVFCLEEIRDDDMVRAIDCPHVFHDGCAGKWRAGKKQRCPLCRTAYVTTGAQGVHVVPVVHEADNGRPVAEMSSAR